MLILLHILYIYTEYIWSYIVNRKNNRSADEPFISEINPSNELDDGDKKSDLVVLNSGKFLVSESVAVLEPEKFNVGCTLPSDNLENDLSTNDTDDKFVFDDSLEEFEQAVYDRETKQIRFFPPVYIQRYITAVNVLKDSRWSADIKKVVDIGCSEFGFFKFLKHVESIEHIVEVDTDRVTLEGFKYRVQPWVSDYLRERERPLEVTILCGNASRPDCHLEGADAVVAIELIEHLYPDDLEELPFNIFGLVKPRIAIFTTPNQDFNILFGNFSGFRHFDHKFEWSRELFVSWAKNICDRYPYYEVSFIGIGPSPKGKEDYGFCSQGAVFVRLDPHLPVEDFSLPPLSSFEEYDIIDHIDYPYKRDTRPEDKITLDDANNFINLAVQAGDYLKGEQCEIPLTAILMRVYKTCAIIDQLKEILQDGGYTIGRNSFGDLIVIVPKAYFDSESSEEEVEQCVVHEYTDASLEDDWDTVNEEQANESSASDDTQLNRVKYNEEKECNKLITYSELMVDKVKSDLKDVANNFYCQFNDVKLPFDICTQLNISKSARKSDENFTKSNSCANAEKPNVVIDLTSSLESYALSGSTSDSNYMNSCVYSSVSIPTSTNLCRNDSDTLETEMRNASFDSGSDFRTNKLLSECEQRKDSDETMLENNDSSLVNSVNSSLSKITLNEDFVADEDDSQFGALDSSSCNGRNFAMERISEEDLKDDVELSVGSAYSVDECVENVQARIKGFNSECGNVRDANCSSELKNSSNSLSRCFSNQQLVSEVDKYSGKEVLKDTSNLKKFDDLISRNKCYDESNDVMVLTSRTQSNFDLVNAKSVSSNCHVNESNLVANDLINDQTYPESNFSSKSPVSVQCSSSSYKKEAPTVLQPGGQLENIFEEVNILDLNKKVGENDHDSNDRYVYFCLNCSSFLSNKRELCQSTCVKSDDKLNTSEELHVNSSNSCMKNVPACSNCRCSSSLMLFEDQSREVIVNTHDFQNDIRIDKKVSKSTLKTDEELVSGGNNKLLKSSNKGCERFVRSSSLGEFDPYPVSKGTLSFFESNSTKDKPDSNVESFAEQYVFNRQSDECLNADAERQDSCSPDKAVDSGYPNSNSGQDMEMDLTPEQVKEIITESESSIENSPLDSPVVEEAAAVQNGVAGIPHPPLVHLGDNVENGDVANNNRDGEGNNMVGEADVNVVVGEPREFHAVIDHPQEMALMDAAGCNFNFEENISEPKIEVDNGAVGDEQSDYLSYNKNITAVKKSITFIVDKDLSQHSTDSDKLSFRLSVTETSCSCPESTFRFTDDETDESASVVSVNNVKEWESIKMVQSFKVKDLKKYESWLVEKITLDRAFVNPGDDTTSINETDSTQSCTSDTTVDCSLAISHSVPDQLFSASTIESDRPSTSHYVDELQTPMSLVDRALNPYIQEIIISEFISANSEPFADWLLQIQLDEPENDVPQDMDNIEPALRIIEELNNDYLHTDSSVEMTVEPDVKGGGDRT